LANRAAIREGGEADWKTKKAMKWAFGHRRGSWARDREKETAVHGKKWVESFTSLLGAERTLMREQLRIDSLDSRRGKRMQS